MERGPRQVRGGNAGDRRGDRPRRRDRLPDRARHGRTCASTSATCSSTPGPRSTRSRGVRLLARPIPAIHAGVISFVLDEAHPHDVATIFDSEGVAVRAGHHCAQPVMLRYDIPATTRASFYVYNDLDDVEALTAADRRHARSSSRTDRWTTCTATSSWSTTGTPITRATWTRTTSTSPIRTRPAATR